MRNLPEVGFSAFRETAWLYVAVVTIVGAGILFSLYAGRVFRHLQLLRVISRSRRKVSTAQMRSVLHPPRFSSPSRITPALDSAASSSNSRLSSASPPQWAGLLCVSDSLRY